MLVERRFNPRARAGRDGRVVDDHELAIFVSIHAPARGATNARLRQCPPRSSFQSTRPRGARPIRIHDARRHRGRVSIHAPARGATTRTSRMRRTMFQSTRPRGARRRRGAFQSTRPRGARPIANVARTRSMFQSTRPRGARRRLAAAQAEAQGFNPRARAGRDARRRPPDARCADLVSIHAPARGATRYARADDARLCQFQSTRPRGARLQALRSSRARTLFQSTRPRGARP